MPKNQLEKTNSLHSQLSIPRFTVSYCRTMATFRKNGSVGLSSKQESAPKNSGKVKALLPSIKIKSRVIDQQQIYTRTDFLVDFEEKRHTAKNNLLMEYCHSKIRKQLSKKPQRSMQTQPTTFESKLGLINKFLELERDTDPYHILQ